MRLLSLTAGLFFILSLTMGSPPARADSCAMTGCPSGQSCVPVPIDPYTSVYQCVDDPPPPDPDPDPAPEMSIMMLPVALGAAGLLAMRSRRKTRNKQPRDDA